MGTATFSVCRAGKTSTARGKMVTSGAHTTSTTGSNLTDGAAGGGSAINLKEGDIISIQVDEAARLIDGGQTATATFGHHIPANETVDIEVSGPGAISVCDVA